MSIKMWAMANSTKASGIRRLEIETVLEYNSGQMVANLKECGDKTKQTVKDE